MLHGMKIVFVLAFKQIYCAHIQTCSSQTKKKQETKNLARELEGMQKQTFLCVLF